MARTVKADVVKGTIGAVMGSMRSDGNGPSIELKYEERGGEVIIHGAGERKLIGEIVNGDIVNCRGSLFLSHDGEWKRVKSEIVAAVKKVRG